MNDFPVDINQFASIDFIKFIAKYTLLKIDAWIIATFV